MNKQQPLTITEKMAFALCHVELSFKIYPSLGSFEAERDMIWPRFIDEAGRTIKTLRELGLSILDSDPRQGFK
jgi:hypothetical protein